MVCTGSDHCPAPPRACCASSALWFPSPASLQSPLMWQRSGRPNRSCVSCCWDSSAHSAHDTQDCCCRTKLPAAAGCRTSPRTSVSWPTQASASRRTGTPLLASWLCRAHDHTWHRQLAQQPSLRRSGPFQSWRGIWWARYPCTRTRTIWLMQTHLALRSSQHLGSTRSPCIQHMYVVSTW